MSVGPNIRKIREERSIKQQEIADLIGMHRSNYSKIENGQREISVEALTKIARLFNLTVDQIINFEGGMPKDVTFEDKATLEQVQLIQQLEPEERNMVYKMIDTFLTKKKFREFVQENMAK